MTKFTKTDKDITAFKPKMKPIYVGKMTDLIEPLPKNVVGKGTLQVKADGEFNYVYIDRDRVYAVNRFGRKTEGLPALKELHMQFLKYEYLESCELLAEMYAVDENGKTLTLPQFIHYLKGHDKSLHNYIHLGLFDFIKFRSNVVGKVKGKNHDSEARFRMLEGLNGKLCHVLEWVKPKNWEEVEDFYKVKVDKEGWEGLVIRANGDTWKAKPNRDVDAVILGINKDNKSYGRGLAKSVRVGLLRDDGTFAVLGDATVPSNAEATELFGLTHVKTAEDGKTVYVKPIVVVKIAYISLFTETTNAVRDSGNTRELGTMPLVKMKSPRIVGYRKDKKVCKSDIGLIQVGVGE